jgi:hypothetical protein
LAALSRFISPVRFWRLLVSSRRPSPVKPRRAKKIPAGLSERRGERTPTHPEERGNKNRDTRPTQPGRRERNLPAKISHLVRFYARGMLAARQMLPARPPFFPGKCPLQLLACRKPRPSRGGNSLSGA